MKRTVKQPDIRRQELLNIGIQLYFEKGEKGISIQQVVKQANVATGLFYYYFNSKDDFLDEALNYYISKEILSFETILDDSSLTASKKLDAVFDAYSQYAKKMAPFRLNKAFYTERHYTLTKKLIAGLKDKVSKLLIQGMSENIFTIGNAPLTAGFILNGLTIVFDTDTDISSETFTELKKYMTKLLEG